MGAFLRFSCFSQNVGVRRCEADVMSADVDGVGYVCRLRNDIESCAEN